MHTTVTLYARLLMRVETDNCAMRAAYEWMFALSSHRLF